MTTFEMGLLLGTVSGVVIGLCIAVILVKLEGRRDRRPGYVHPPRMSFEPPVEKRPSITLRHSDGTPYMNVYEYWKQRSSEDGFPTTTRWRS